jgi:ubiquinone biosynthesis protein UbiJ
MKVPGLDFPLIKLVNRVLADYPLARDRLRIHAGKMVAAQVGPADFRVRIDGHGEIEMVGAGGAADETAAVSFVVPLTLLPRLARGEDSAFNAIEFIGDGELAAAISTVARNVKWDVEEDLSRVVGDIAAHRLVGGARDFSAWTRDANSRLMDNFAEYLGEERRSFVTRRDLDELTLANETLRDDLARLEARLGKLTRAG